MSDESKKKRKFLQRLADKYRLVILNDSSFQELGYIRLSRFNIISLSGTFLILVIALTYTVIAYTPIREQIPGYPDAEMRKNIILNAQRLDSLDNEIKFRDQYFANLSQIISGKEPEDFMSMESDSFHNVSTIQFAKSSADSLLRSEIEIPDRMNLNPGEQKVESIRLERLHFFSPVRGLVTNNFNPLANHYGADIVASPNAVVKAVLDGTVIMATWTLETGYVIQIQHDYNLISVYKHNAELLKKTGMHVKAGEAIAIVGNSGELTTGPHLHFELWQNGVPLNPEEHVVF